MDIRNNGETLDALRVDVAGEIKKFRKSEAIFKDGLGVSPEELLRKAEIAYGEKGPLTGEQAKIFANSVERWLTLADGYSNNDVWFSFVFMKPNVSGTKAAGAVYRAHEKFMDELVTTTVFLKAVARLGLVPPHDETWGLAALDFYHEDEDLSGHVPGLVFPSWALRNWAMTAFTRQEARDLFSRWARKE